MLEMILQMNLLEVSIMESNGYHNTTTSPGKPWLSWIVFKKLHEIQNLDIFWHVAHFLVGIVALIFQGVCQMFPVVDTQGGHPYHFYLSWI